MLKEIDAVKLIFGLKVQQLRREHNLSYQQLSDRTGLAISYLHNIEKGKKYPKTDKILALAKALETDYNYLVSLQGDKKLKPIVDLLNSDFLKVFPLEMFGINTAKLMELLAHTPDKVNAFLSTVIKIIRNYHMQGEDFYKAALRSYQDLHNNHFEDIETAVHRFRKTYKIKVKPPISNKYLEEILQLHFGIKTDRKLLPQKEALGTVRSYYSPAQKTLYINQNLSAAQENFLLAKELGFQHMAFKERPLETRMTEVNSFDKLLNNFKASYFSVALLINEKEIVKDIEWMASWKKWEPEKFLSLLDKYDAPAEMLVQRLANILPRHFGIKDIFFLRFYTQPDLSKFIITKEMHLSQLHDPHANQLYEHYCRRWISISLIRKLKAMRSMEGVKEPIAGAQISRYWGTPNAYFCLCIAKPSTDIPENSVSLTIGLLINDRLRRLFPFLNDPDLKIKDVHTTCERCGISDCEARAFPPIRLQKAKEKERIQVELGALERGLKGKD